MRRGGLVSSRWHQQTSGGEVLWSKWRDERGFVVTCVVSTPVYTKLFLY